MVFLFLARSQVHKLRGVWEGVKGEGGDVETDDGDVGVLLRRAEQTQLPSVGINKERESWSEESADEDSVQCC